MNKNYWIAFFIFISFLKLIFFIQKNNEIEKEINVDNHSSYQEVELDSEIKKELKSKLPQCIGLDENNWNNCYGIVTAISGNVYEGEFKNGKLNGIGFYTFNNGNKYEGEFKDGKYHGQGSYRYSNGKKYDGEWVNGVENGLGILLNENGKKVEGLFENGKLIREVDVTIANDNFEIQSKQKNNLQDNLRSFEYDLKIKEEHAKERQHNNQNINLQISNTQPDAYGILNIFIKTNSDTASLKINDEEQGGRQDGIYSIKKIARAGQDTTFNIVAIDMNGNTESKSIIVARPINSSNQPKYAELNPALIKSQPSKDAVAIIIGIQNYKRVSKAEYANNDAQAFYDYAIRAIGIKPENIKLLVDEQADEAEILAAFQNWLPVKIRKLKTEVYVFYSGHGLPSDDGSSLYILPYGADKNFISKTAINQQEIIEALQSVQPKSVTMFMDACYSGQIRTGENLITDARPIKTKANAWSFPPDFTVITASQSDQIASSSIDFKHGIFSYYLMKGMEGDADGNNDNKITAGEMQIYLQDMVSRKAMHVNRKQVPQLIGDANRVLVGK